MNVQLFHLLYQIGDCLSKSVEVLVVISTFHSGQVFSFFLSGEGGKPSREDFVL